jgi:hypothetical protein
MTDINNTAASHFQMLADLQPGRTAALVGINRGTL